jgi:hypothetical protein
VLNDIAALYQYSAKGSRVVHCLGKNEQCVLEMLADFDLNINLLSSVWGELIFIFVLDSLKSSYRTDKLSLSDIMKEYAIC